MCIADLDDTMRSFSTAEKYACSDNMRSFSTAENMRDVKSAHFSQTASNNDFNIIATNLSEVMCDNPLMVARDFMNTLG